MITHTQLANLMGKESLSEGSFMVFCSKFCKILCDLILVRNGLQYIAFVLVIPPSIAKKGKEVTIHKPQGCEHCCSRGDKSLICRSSGWYFLLFTCMFLCVNDLLGNSQSM